ncbi:hypothetical protein AB9F41_37315, partial [Rhizobium leguminosarum]
IYAFLVLLFHDFLQPLTLLMALPLSLDVTPSAAARAKSGVIWISGACLDAVDVTAPMPCSVSSCSSSAVLALSRTFASSL